jgi:hypothetical protein
MNHLGLTHEEEGVFATVSTPDGQFFGGGTKDTRYNVQKERSVRKMHPYMQRRNSHYDENAGNLTEKSELFC